MIRKQDHLVQLVRTLTSNEKRYFKLFSSLQPGEKLYLRLFDALEDKEKYDAATLCAETGLTSKQLADNKYYLTQNLLQSLRNYDTESSEIAALRSNRENAQVLLTRRMFDFALDILEKTIEKAWELEAFEHIDSLLLLRNTCLQNTGRYDEGKDMDAQHNKAAECLDELFELIAMRNAARELETRGAGAGHFKKILAHPLLKQKVGTLKSLRAKSLRYEVLSYYYNSTGDEEGLYQSSLEERTLYLKNPQIKVISPIVYLTNISRLAGGGQNYETRLKHVHSLYHELDSPDINISKQRSDSIRWSAMLSSLWTLRYLGRFKDALKIAQDTYAQSTHKSEYQRFSATFEYALILLFNGHVAEATDKTDELLRYKSDVRSNMQPFARLLYIMIQLELRNYSIVVPTIKSAKAWFKSHGFKLSETDLFFKHATAISKSTFERNDGWRDLLKDAEAGKFATMNRLVHFNLWVKNMNSVKS